MPLSAGVNSTGSRSGYVPSAIITRMGWLTVTDAFSLRTASRAPFNVATGPFVPAALGLGNWPVHSSLPSGETCSVTPWPHATPARTRDTAARVAR